MPYIYESPDGGVTIYRRNSGEEERTEISRAVKDPGGNGWSLQEALRLSEQFRLWKDILARSYDDPYIRDMINKIEVYHELKYK